MSKTPGDPVLVEMFDLKIYLDNAIMKWRQEKINANLQKAEDDATIASCYIDAFQSMRLFAFGELLK